jgi:hypothetical protein
MAADNHTTIVGNLVDDPELRFTNNGIAVANMRVAVTQRIQQDGEWRDGDTSFLKVVMGQTSCPGCSPASSHYCSNTCSSRLPGMPTWEAHDPTLSRPIAAPLERCAELLGVDLDAIRQAAAHVEP